MSSDIANIALWIVNSIYFCGLFAQMVKNYRLRSTAGLSDGMLAGYAAAYTSYIIFMAANNFPPSCTIVIPMCLGVVVMMIAQRFAYGSGDMSSTMLALIYGTMIVASCAAYWNFALYKALVGQIAGSISLFFWFIFQIPQMVKIYRSKSVEGFSFAFLVIMSLGAVVELLSSLVLQLPLLTIVNISRGLLFYGIFYIQFFMYSRNATSSKEAL